MELNKLKFVSEKREKDFNKLNIFSAEDLIKHFPRDYLDLTHVTKVAEAYHNDLILTLCEVINVEAVRNARRSFVKAILRQGNYLFRAVWFNMPYMAQKLKAGEYLFYGRVRYGYDTGITMVNPSAEPAERNRNLKGLIPVYSLSGTLTQGVVRTAIRNALPLVKIKSFIPEPLCEKYALIPLRDAYYKVHNPQNKAEASEGAERIAIEEYFMLISAFKAIKGGRNEARLNSYSVSENEVSTFISRFPFSFTNGQKDAVKEIFENLKSPRKMNRLLQGDVGCGKTAVALVAIYMAVKSGFQAAMLAPTEVLARQNAEVLKKYLPEFKCCYLSGATGAEEKRRIKKELTKGEINVVCGTHAVIQKDVVFKNLSLVVCDEQHRFGVAQRASLAEKGEGCDVLVMSATPIPRTLSLIFYGDLDITTIREKPQNRLKIKTAIISENKYEDMLAYVSRQAESGNQTYFVCPKIEGDEEGSCAAVTELYEELKSKLNTTVALLHGKMRDKQKNEVMQAFKEKKYMCLVSTTVIEVGVDVPDATVMIIYNAERFGLAQLHQLRGRVGRGDKQSYCFLLAGSDTDEARERLSVIKNLYDGFDIAEADLKLRGGGDFMGTRQSGRTLGEIKNLKFSVNCLFTAKALSDEAFSGRFDVNLLARIAVEKYSELQDVTLN